MIKPTVGRIVWFFPTRKADETQPEPQAAIVTTIHGDRCVSICLFPHNSAPVSKTSVRLRQEEDPPELVEHCEWMPYQVGQAKAAQGKTDPRPNH